jgi:hypothetical protein
VAPTATTTAFDVVSDPLADVITKLPAVPSTRATGSVSWSPTKRLRNQSA